MLLPFSRICSSFVIRLPSAVVSISCTSSSTILTYTSKPRSVPTISLSPFIMTQICEPMHRSINSDGSRWLGLACMLPFLGAIMVPEGKVTERCRITYQNQRAAAWWLQGSQTTGAAAAAAAATAEGDRRRYDSTGSTC
eukprot:GHRQ01010012.1.p1 GENE.GHRQ01010012.1~~GHRQ01010012.1.p1  ORF type:complete len:139 (-),score=13.04 GHRQ01010012.1:10-426(-)